MLNINVVFGAFWNANITLADNSLHLFWTELPCSQQTLCFQKFSNYDKNYSKLFESSPKGFFSLHPYFCNPSMLLLRLLARFAYWVASCYFEYVNSTDVPPIPQSIAYALEGYTIHKLALHRPSLFCLFTSNPEVRKSQNRSHFQRKPSKIGNSCDLIWSVSIVLTDFGKPISGAYAYHSTPLPALHFLESKSDPLTLVARCKMRDCKFYAFILSFRYDQRAESGCPFQENSGKKFLLGIRREISSRSCLLCLRSDDSWVLVHKLVVCKLVGKHPCCVLFHRRVQHAFTSSFFVIPLD